MRRTARQPARIRHPDPGIELKLQQIIGLQEAITRRQRVITECLDQMRDARHQQNEASDTLNGSGQAKRIEEFEANMTAQARRIEAAGTGILAAEESIAAAREEIVKIAAEIPDTDLAYL